MKKDGEFTPVDAGRVPEIVFEGSKVPVGKLSEYTLSHAVRFKTPLTKTGPEFLFTGSILMSTDGRLYFIPSGQFDELQISTDSLPAAE